MVKKVFNLDKYYYASRRIIKGYEHDCEESEEWVDGYTKRDGTYIAGYCRKIKER